MADIDAAIITFSRLPPNALDGFDAAAALTIPTLLNTGFKAMLAIILGGRSNGFAAALPLLLAILASAIATAIFAAMAH